MANYDSSITTWAKNEPSNPWEFYSCISKRVPRMKKWEENFLNLKKCC